MRVICIDSEIREGEYKAKVLKDGGFYTVESEGFGTDNNGKRIRCYGLVEFSHITTPNGYTPGFAADRFIPLSEIDETELAEQRLQTA